ncbi:MAG: hypothetical protein KAJ17_13335, partial [Candidatus Krumholzibacteria bacterium]|nr:hypothetical protein [Candidatus Krumholzibacteria bacterium]
VRAIGDTAEVLCQPLITQAFINRDGVPEQAGAGSTGEPTRRLDHKAKKGVADTYFRFSSAILQASVSNGPSNALIFDFSRA